MPRRKRRTEYPPCPVCEKPCEEAPPTEPFTSYINISEAKDFLVCPCCGQVVDLDSKRIEYSERARKWVHEARESISALFANDPITKQTGEAFGNLSDSLGRAQTAVGEAMHLLNLNCIDIAPLEKVTHLLEDCRTSVRKEMRAEGCFGAFKRARIKRLGIQKSSD
jgi:hypothetical protein